jgi:hypothetical protein
MTVPCERRNTPAARRPDEEEVRTRGVYTVRDGLPYKISPVLLGSL